MHVNDFARYVFKALFTKQVCSNRAKIELLCKKKKRGLTVG